LPRRPDPDTYRRASGPLAANFSLPITFEPAGASAGQTVQYVGRGEGMTELLESDGIEIAVPKRAGGTATPSTVKLRLVHGAGASVASATSIGATYGNPTGPPARRKKRRSSKSASHSHRRGTRKARPHRDTPGHKGQAARAQHSPQQRLPRQTKPTGQLEIPQGNQGTREANFVWQGVAPAGGETDYFMGNDPAKWRTHVRHFGEASATKVLPGVDIVAYGNSEGFEYDLRVGPGVDPSDLRLEIAADGAARSENIRLDASGDLHMTLDGRELRMKKPTIYEERAASASQPVKRKQIVGGYELAADGSVAFHLGPHDSDATLVLDPSLSVAYTTFLGGAGNDAAESIALDASGNVYIGGTTTSAATFTEAGSSKLGSTGGSDFFIAKINPSLSGPRSLVYLTFIGGSGAEAGGKIAADSNGNLAIAGTSSSADYPTTDGSALTTGTNGTAVNDAAVTEIDPTGAKLVYSTLFGGNGNEGSLSSGGIAMDSAGDIFIAMDTASTNLPVAPTAAPGPYSSVYGGGASDGFLAVFQPVVTGTTSHVKYCTYLGIDAIATVTGATRRSGCGALRFHRGSENRNPDNHGQCTDQPANHRAVGGRYRLLPRAFGRRESDGHCGHSCYLQTPCRFRARVRGPDCVDLFRYCIAQHVHGDACDGESHFGRAGSHRAHRGHRREWRHAVGQNSTRAALRSGAPFSGSMGSARNCTVAACAALGDRRVEFDCIARSDG